MTMDYGRLQQVSGAKEQINTGDRQTVGIKLQMIVDTVDDSRLLKMKMAIDDSRLQRLTMTV